MESVFIVHATTLKAREMFNVPEITAFCTSWRTPLLLLPTNSFSSTSKSRHHPSNTSIMSLYCFTSYLWYFCFNSQRSGPYFVVFSSFFFSRFLTHGQLISSVMTRFDKWLIMRASTLLALTSWCSANRGTSQNACALFDSYTGFGFNGEYQGGTESTSLAKSRRKGSSGLHSGNVLVLCKGGTTSQDMGSLRAGSLSAVGEKESLHASL